MTAAADRVRSRDHPGRTRAESGEATRASSRRATRRSRRAATRAERGGVHAVRWFRGKGEQRGFLASYDEELRATVERVRPRTMTGPAKLAALVEATRHVVRQEIPGAIVECGVWRGGSMQAVAFTLLDLGAADRDLHLFDTFAGMPPPSRADTRTTQRGVVHAQELLAASERSSKLWAVADVDDVRAAMAEPGYPDEKVFFHPGVVEETTPSEAPATIALLRLDTDWYASTKHELEHLYDRLSPGGVLILDDYGDWDGARKAVDEWLSRRREPLFLAPMGSGRIAVKPAPAPDDPG